MVDALTAVPDTLVTTYLEMDDPAQFRPAFSESPHVHIERMARPDVNFYRYLYREVGEAWRWRDRLLVPREQLRRELANPATSVYVMYVDDEPAGYIELSEQGESTEIAYFGLREKFFGRGLGKHLLSYGIQRAWDDGARRLWVHTCNLDGPHALNNYRKRGFQVYMERREEMPERYL